MQTVIAMPVPPAGFKLEYACSCGLGCTPDDLNTTENCEILGSGYNGPGVHLVDNPGVQINSHWTAKDGIKFHLSNHGHTSDDDDAEYVERPWTREQLQLIPFMIQRVLVQIDEAKENGQ